MELRFHIRNLLSVLLTLYNDASYEKCENSLADMPVCVLKALHDLYRKHVRSSALNHLAATFQNHVAHYLLTIAQLLNQIGEDWAEIFLKVD